MKQTILFTLFLLLPFLATAQSDSTFVFKDGAKTMKLELENTLSYLELNKPTKFKVTFENVDMSKWAIIGRAVRILHHESSANFVVCSVTVDEKGVVDHHYKLIVRYDISDKNEPKYHYFLIPVK